MGKLDNRLNEVIYDIENSGMTIQQIADKYGVSYYTIYNIVRDNKLQYKKHTRALKIENIQELINDIENSDMSLREIGDKYNISFETVRQIIIKQGLKYKNKRADISTGITPEMIHDIENSDMTLQQIADKYGVHQTTVRNIIIKQGLKYKNKRADISTITQEMIYDIENSGMTLQQIADKYGVSCNYVYRIVKKYNLNYEHARKSQLPIEIINDIVNSSMTYKQIAVKYGISNQRVSQIQQKFELKRVYIDKIKKEMMSDIENSGMSLSQIANKYKVSYNFVNDIVIKNNLKYKKHTGGTHRATEITQEFIYDIENSSMTQHQIASKYGVSDWFVHNAIIKYNLQYDRKKCTKEKKELTDEIRYNIKYDIEHSDMTLQQIADKYNISRYILQDEIRQQELEYESKKKTVDVTLELIKDIENSNMTLQQIADKHNITIKTLRRIIARNNLKYIPKK